LRPSYSVQVRFIMVWNSSVAYMVLCSSTLPYSARDAKSLLFNIPGMML